MLQASPIKTVSLSPRPSFRRLVELCSRSGLKVIFTVPKFHLPIKFGADIFIQSGVIDIFRKLKTVAAAILDLFG